MTTSPPLPRDVLVARIASYVGEFTLALRPEEVPAGARVPGAWLDLLRAQADTGRPSVPGAWAEFADELPAVHEYLATALRGVALLLTPGAEPSLLYIHTYDGGSRPSFYVGRPPISEAQLPPPVAAVWPNLPAKLRRFYTAVPDGWTELASDAGGPARVERLAFLSDGDWEFDEGVMEGWPVKPGDVLLAFSNAAGDYLGLNAAAPTWDGSTQGVLFFHDAATLEAGQDFWALLDVWFGIFVERADRLRPAVGA